MTRGLPPPRSRPAVRFGGLLLLLTGFGLALLLLPKPDLARVSELVARLGPLAPVAAVLVGAALLIALIPRTVVTLAWGALFGPLDGAGYTLAAALLAAAVGFGVGRLLGRDFVHAAAVPERGRLGAQSAGFRVGARATLAERLRARLARLDGWLSRQSVLGVLTVRLLPIGGFGLVSYGYGVTGARLWPYLTGSLLACVPSAFGYAAIGAAATAPGRIDWFAAAPAGLGLIATAVIVTRWWRRRASAARRPHSG